MRTQKLLSPIKFTLNLVKRENINYGFALENTFCIENIYPIKNGLFLTTRKFGAGTEWTFNSKGWRSFLYLLTRQGDSAFFSDTRSSKRHLRKTDLINFSEPNLQNKQSTVSVEQIDDKIHITTLKDDITSTKRPVVVMFAWLLAKPKHLHKYESMYLGMGCDVITVKTKVLDVLWPCRCQRTVDKALELVSRPSLHDQPLIVHGFSVGGYMYGKLLLTAQREPPRWDSVSKRLRGQIFDSALDFDNASEGLARTFSDVFFVQRLIKAIVDAYLTLNAAVTRDYIESSKAFKDNALKIPSLMLYSHSDMVGMAERIESVCQEWAANGVTVHTRGWRDSPHVQHLHRHPEEYTSAVKDFLSVVLPPGGPSSRDVIDQRSPKVTGHASKVTPVPLRSPTEPGVHRQL